MTTIGVIPHVLSKAQKAARAIALCKAVMDLPSDAKCDPCIYDFGVCLIAGTNGPVCLTCNIQLNHIFKAFLYSALESKPISPTSITMALTRWKYNQNLGPHLPMLAAGSNNMAKFYHLVQDEKDAVDRALIVLN